MDGQLSIFDFPEFLPEEANENPIWSEVHCGTEKVINKGKPNHMICRFSDHTCNKEELWKIADTFDDINCEHVCCRACSVRGCGARCNGSTEPLPEKCFSCRHIMGKEGCYLKECVFEPKLSCEGCIDHKKRKYKGTMCLKGCIRYCYNPDVIVGTEPDYWREE